MENKKFIITTSADTADVLTKIGFKLVQQSDGKWTFLNNNKLVFSNLKNVSYSNILHM